MREALWSAARSAALDSRCERDVVGFRDDPKRRFTPHSKALRALLARPG
jgi:hypothetical protein